MYRDFIMPTYVHPELNNIRELDPLSRAGVVNDFDFSILQTLEGRVDFIYMHIQVLGDFPRSTAPSSWKVIKNTLSQWFHTN